MREIGSLRFVLVRTGEVEKIERGSRKAGPRRAHNVITHSLTVAPDWRPRIMVGKADSEPRANKHS
jgi:hypothetical protein